MMPWWLASSQSTSGRAQVRERCRKGIPPSIRARAWLHLCGAKYQVRFFKMGNYHRHHMIDGEFWESANVSSSLEQQSMRAEVARRHWEGSPQVRERIVITGLLSSKMRLAGASWSRYWVMVEEVNIFHYDHIYIWRIFYVCDSFHIILYNFFLVN